MNGNKPAARAVELTPLVKQIDVRRSAPDAFRLFTQEISGWWPLKTHTRAKDAAGEVTVKVVCETRAGGRLYETLNTGEERDWGEVLAVEDGKLIRFSFGMGAPKDKTGHVEVRFDPIDDKSCRVTLTHSNWENFGDTAEYMRGRSSEGWDVAFIERFAAFANGA